jgi:hypothetical protein
MCHLSIYFFACGQEHSRRWGPCKEAPKDCSTCRNREVSVDILELNQCSKCIVCEIRDYQEKKTTLGSGFEFGMVLLSSYLPRFDTSKGKTQEDTPSPPPITVISCGHRIIILKQEMREFTKHQLRMLFGIGNMFSCKSAHSPASSSLAQHKAARNIHHHPKGKL